MKYASAVLGVRITELSHKSATGVQLNQDNVVRIYGTTEHLDLYSDAVGAGERGRHDEVDHQRDGEK